MFEGFGCLRVLEDFVQLPRFWRQDGSGFNNLISMRLWVKVSFQASGSSLGKLITGNPAVLALPWTFVPNLIKLKPHTNPYLVLPWGYIICTPAHCIKVSFLVLHFSYKTSQNIEPRESETRQLITRQFKDLGSAGTTRNPTIY